MNDQEKRELMIKAAVKFKGKWPKGATHIYNLGEKIAAAEANGDLNPVEIPSPANMSTFLIVGEGSWQPFCNQQEFEAFMDDLADKAPEGAECVSIFDNGSDCYYKNVEAFSYSFFYNEDGRWHYSEGSPIGNPIPLPKREPTPWVPEVGQDFEWMLDGVSEKWHYGYFVGLDKVGDIVIQREDKLDGLNTRTKNHNYKFRPLRTEAEIEREELASDIIRIAKSITSDRFMPKEAEHEFTKLAENIYALGYRKTND